MALIAKRVIEIEVKNLGFITSETEVPEFVRVHDIYLHQFTAPDLAINMSRKVNGIDDEWDVILEKSTHDHETH